MTRHDVTIFVTIVGWKRFWRCLTWFSSVLWFARNNLEERKVPGSSRIGSELARGNVRLPESVKNVRIVTQSMPDTALLGIICQHRLLLILKTDSPYLLVKCVYFRTKSEEASVCNFDTHKPPLIILLSSSWEVTNLAQVSLLTRQDFDTN